MAEEDEKPKAIVYDLTPSGRDRAREFAEKLGEVLGLYGARRLVCFSAKQNYRAYVGETNDDQTVFSRTKKFCEFFSARLLGTPCDQVRLVGAFARWAKARSRSVNKHSVSLWQAIFRMKGVMGYPTDGMVVESICGHQRTTNTPSQQSPEVEELFGVIRPYLDKLRQRLVSKWEVPIIEETCSATGSSQSSRLVGGKTGYLNRGLYDYWETDTQMVRHLWCEEQERLSDRIMLPTDLAPGPRGTPDVIPEIRYLGTAYSSRFPVVTQSAEEFKNPGLIAYDPDSTASRPVLTPSGPSVECYGDYSTAKIVWTEHVVKTALRDIESGADFELAASVVMEAGGKIRIVTRGSAAENTLALGFQQDLFSEMKKTSVFPSLSRKICGMQISQKFGDLPDGWIVESSDFKGATDNLSPVLTNRILEYLSNGHPWQEIIMRNNGDKKIRYPVVPLLAPPGCPFTKLKGPGEYEYVLVPDEIPKELKGEWGRYPKIWVKIFNTEYYIFGKFLTALKTKGQLMGQATSFPLLCLANLACSLLAYKRVLPDLHWEEAMKFLIINGDDRAAAGPPGLKDAFWEVANPIGFQESPGKSHYHKKYLGINSQDYVPTGNGTWFRVPSMRVNLLYGVKKLPSDQFCPSQIITALFETVPYRSMQATIALFLSRWKNRLLLETQGRNLFLPVSLGGFGQDAPVGWEWTVTPYQTGMADYLVGLQPCCDFVFGPPRTETSHLRERGNGLPWDIVTTLVRNTKYVDPAVFENEQFRLRYCQKTIREFGRMKEVSLVFCPGRPRAPCGKAVFPGEICCGSPVRPCPSPREVTRKDCEYGCDLHWDLDCHLGLDHVITAHSYTVCGCSGGCPNPEVYKAKREIRISKDWLVSRPVVRPNLEYYPLHSNRVAAVWDKNPEYTRLVLERSPCDIPLPV